MERLFATEQKRQEQMAPCRESDARLAAPVWNREVDQIASSPPSQPCWRSSQASTSCSDDTNLRSFLRTLFNWMSCRLIVIRASRLACAPNETGFKIPQCAEIRLRLRKAQLLKVLEADWMPTADAWSRIQLFRKMTPRVWGKLLPVHIMITCGSSQLN